jgi:hypothetical protein
MSSPKFVTFHNPLKHTVTDLKTGKKSQVDGVALRFSIPRSEDGKKDNYELEPGEQMQIEEGLAYAAKIYAPQLVEGPAPEQKKPTT